VIVVALHLLVGLLLSNLLEDGFVGDLAEVGALNFRADTVQRAAKGVLGGSINHLALLSCKRSLPESRDR